MSVPGLDIQGIELAAYWWTEESDTGCTAQRGFVFSYDEMYGIGTDKLEDIPSIGMPFDATTAPWNRTWLREIHCEKIGKDEDKTVIVCSYSNAPWDRASATTGDDPVIDVTDQTIGPYLMEWLLPMQMEMSGEMQEVGTENSWEWEDSTASPKETVIQPVYLITRTNNISVTRIIGRSPYDIQTYMQLMQSLAGKICSGESPDDNPFNANIHSLLYTGGNARPYIDHSGTPMWEIDLNFSVRCIGDDISTDPDGGWNLIPRIKADTALYDLPVIGIQGVSTPLYEEADLLELLMYQAPPP